MWQKTQIKALRATHECAVHDKSEPYYNSRTDAFRQPPMLMNAVNLPRLAMLLAFLHAAGLHLPVGAHAAQPAGILAACTDKTGQNLDLCMKNATRPLFSQGVAPIPPEGKPPPTIVLCRLVGTADYAYCVARNEVILECRTRFKPEQEVRTCADTAMVRKAVKLSPAICLRPAAATRLESARCVLRNRHYRTCAATPYDYFSCLDQKIEADKP